MEEVGLLNCHSICMILSTVPSPHGVFWSSRLVHFPRGDRSSSIMEAYTMVFANPNSTLDLFWNLSLPSKRCSVPFNSNRYCFNRYTFATNIIRQMQLLDSDIIIFTPLTCQISATNHRLSNDTDRRNFLCFFFLLSSFTPSTVLKKI